MDSCSLQDSSAGSASYKPGYWSDELRAPKLPRRAYKDAIAELFAFGASMLNEAWEQQEDEDRASPSLVSQNISVSRFVLSTLIR